MRNIRSKQLPAFFVCCLFCVGLYGLHRHQVGRDGALPGVVETFEPSYGDRPSGGFQTPPGEVWGMERASSTNTNLYVMGPVGGGRVVPRVYCDRQGRVTGVVQPDGSVQWKEAGR